MLVVSVWGSMFVALAFVVLISLQSGPVGAQTGGGGNGGGTGNNAAVQQYGEREINVIVDTIPDDKVLTNTGGWSILVGAALMLVVSTVVGSKVIGRR